LLATAKQKPDSLSYGTSGNGTSAHLAGELLNSMAGVRIVAIPYKGGAPALTAVLAGDIPVSINPLPEVVGQLDSGLVRVLAVTTATRSKTLPDVPTVAETVPGYEASAWFGLGAPKGTPAEIVDKLNAAVNAGLADPKLKGRLADLGGTMLLGPPADFGKLIAEETEKWAKVVKFSGARPD